ncbi:MAG TPA: alkaline phosphatase family protein, partial [Acidobacteriota bacterium]|nr:alkaline phosphatase family protein [Acidobacteriota bacterium]
MKTSQKVIVIGLDGASPEIFFDKWEDEFPHLKKIREKGLSGSLKSSIPPVTAPAWTSFATGCNPGKHGIYDFLYKDEKTHEIRPVTSKNIKAPTVYEILKEYGMKSILINLPLSYPPKTDNITITSLLTQGDEFVFPRELKKEIPELDKYRIVPDPIFYVKFNKKKFIEDISDLEKTKFEIAKKLFAKDWNLFFILFGGTDWIQHKFYSDMVKNSKEKNQIIIDFYKELDSYIGWFLENRDNNTTLFIMSDHGFNTYKGVIGLNNLLEKYGYLRFKKGKGKEVIPSRRLKEISKKQNNTKLLKINPLLARLLTRSRFITDLLKK